MARKPAQPAEAAQPLPEIRPDAIEAANTMAAISATYDEDRDLVNQLLGQAQMAGAGMDIFRTVRTAKLAFVKENKLYRMMSGKKIPHGAEKMRGTWAEFCSLLGRSVDQVDRDIENLREFGEAALESMTSMGIGYRELRQFRRLPEDQKTALAEAAQDGDKESFLELVDELVAKHTKEKEALERQIEEAEATLAARSRVLEGKSARVDQLTEELVKTRRRIQADAPADVAEALRLEATSMVGMAEVQIRACRAAFKALNAHTDSTGISHEDFASGLICQLELTLKEMRGDFFIKTQPDGDNTPEWMRPISKEEERAQMREMAKGTDWDFDDDGKMVLRSSLVRDEQA